MKRQIEGEVRPTNKSASPKLIEPQSQLDKLTRLEQTIAHRAYELFESRGCEAGYDLADWLSAEADIRQSLPIKLSEHEDRLSVEAEMPGFKADEIEVSVEPRRLIISGTTDQADKTEENTFARELQVESVKTKYTFRLIELPVEIDARTVEANFTDEVLRISLPKIVVDKPFYAKASVS
jgi:HSP20 family molecular chaperone IbpA